MHRVTFFPIGNADCTFVELDNGQNLLFDYFNPTIEGDSDKRWNVAEYLKDKLDEKDIDFFDVVSFTHCDLDHLKGFSELFLLKHHSDYQDDTRIKIKELWVPASVLVDDSTTEEGEILKTEAQHRFIEQEDIRVFSTSGTLQDWCNQQGISLEERKHLITYAGETIPNFTCEVNGVEFFSHSPFAKNCDGEQVDRNKGSLIFQASFAFRNRISKMFLIGDTPWDVLRDVVEISKENGNEDKLEWDIYSLPHHCSYMSLGEEKGSSSTPVDPSVEELLNKGSSRGFIVSSSEKIPTNNTDQPPHKQAAARYKLIADRQEYEFIVTMEYPDNDSPEPLIFHIDSLGVTKKKKSWSGSTLITTTQPPRAGK